jgi:magnesium chelatase subunit I
VLERAARLCVVHGSDGLSGELTLIRVATAYAALEDVSKVTDVELKRVAPMVLSHRLRRNPLDDSGSSTRVARALEEVFAK